ncbi:ankyrin repeat domain-containing protein [Hymenobacter sp. PAMC 26628]|uniref:ankyrin repeat domain-containing protein n=1 Tax=Hymenobacter sp. PAMC 26628 TaxID=1484118 RepID=UPI00090203AD|nr:ankyrin repeat domain-containing protein [Hymenobacter sp. PAMC 26628]
MAQSGRPRKCDPKVDNIRSNIALNKYDTAKETLQEFGIDATDGYGRTALINAVIENKANFICWLVDNGANINHQDRIGYSALHFIGQNKIVDLAKYFLQKGADPNLQDIHGNTALWTTILNAKFSTEGHEIIALLLKFGSDPNKINNYGKTPKFIYETIRGADISMVDTSG